MSRRDRKSRSHWRLDGKPKYSWPSKHGAEVAATEWNRDSTLGKDRFMPYHCSKCGRFHIGRSEVVADATVDEVTSQADEAQTGR
jgi:hypothetical protein